MAQSLTEIANYHATDKGTQGPSKAWRAHNYTDVYEPYLDPYRDSEISLLEIGLGVLGDRWESHIVHGRNSGGASLRMWYDYFPRASVFGIDVNECGYLDNDRIKTFVADQSNVADLAAFVAASGVDEFDVIVDDGSHRPDHQQIALSLLFDRLKSGGLYFIEDLQANGKGDGATGRMSSDDILNTRRVLRQWCDSGGFGQPNAFLDEVNLAMQIDTVRFHVPEVSIWYAKGSRLGRPLQRVVRFEPETETLCVIRKKQG